MEYRNEEPQCSLIRTEIFMNLKIICMTKNYKGHNLDTYLKHDIHLKENNFVGK